MGGADAPVVVLGAPRSGTSLLYRLLCLHPDATWVSNWVGRAPNVRALASLNRFARRTHRMRTRVWFGADPYADGRRRGLVERLFPQPVEGEPLFRAHDLPEATDETEPTRRQTALRRTVEDLTRFSGGRVFVSKRIAHNRRVPLLHAIFPEARFVVLTRDGRAVAESLSLADWWPHEQVWWYGGTPTDWQRAGRDPWEIRARHWVREVEALEHGLSRLADARVLQVRYEDLVSDPTAALARVGAFCDLPQGRTWRRALSQVTLPATDDTWRERLGAARDTVESIQAGWLRKYGYLS